MIRRIAYWSTAPLISLIAFHRVFSTWFQSDDFGWMSLREWIPESGVLYTLFHPAAQGQVRVLSERVLWLTFPVMFGMNALPYRILALATWIVVLTFALLIGTRLTGSRAGGLLAAVFLAVNANFTRPLGWSANYNEILCAACLLAAFYFRLRGRTAGEWVAYLVAFGALELAVVYPAVAALHALLLDRKKLRSALPLFIPAVMFAVAHALWIPKAASKEYRLAIDGRIFSTLHNYWRWSAGPSRISDFTAVLGETGGIVTAIISGALLLFLAWRIRNRDYLPLFALGWFVLFLGPALLLPNHVVDYILVIPLAGLAWLAASGVLRGWRAGVFGRAIAGTLAAIYLAGMFYETSLYTEWWRARSLRARAVVEGVAKAHRAHPELAFILQGIDDEVFSTAIRDNPFEIIGVNAYIAPDQPLHVDPTELRRWEVDSRRAMRMVEHGEARVLALAGPTTRDVTPIYRTVTPRGDFVDVADSRSAAQLGPGWYAAEDRLRWMGKSATVKLWGPESSSQELHVTGYAPAALLRGGPVTLRFSVNGMAIGTSVVKSADQPFAFEFAFPDALVGLPEIELRIEASRTFRAPGDERDLGMAFGTFAIK